MNGITNFRRAATSMATVNVATDVYLFCMKCRSFDCGSITVEFDGSVARPSPCIHPANALDASTACVTGKAAPRRPVMLDTCYAAAIRIPKDGNAIRGSTGLSTKGSPTKQRSDSIRRPERFAPRHPKPP